MRAKKGIEFINQKSNVLAFIFMVPALLAFLCTEPTLSGAGDMNLAELLMSAGKIKDGYFFISPLLSRFLRLFCSFCNLNWWSVFSVFIMFLGLYIFLWFIANRIISYDFVTKMIVLELFVIVFWELILKYEINFTQTATIASLSGMLILFNGVLPWGKYDEDVVLTKRKTANIYISLICAVLLMWLSGEIRNKAFYLTVPFGIMSMIYCYIFPLCSNNLINSLKSSWKNRKRAILICIVLVIELLVVIGARKVYNLDEGLKSWYETNKSAENINDYAERYPSYEYETKIYDNLGIKASWLEMIMNHSFSDYRVFSSETLHIMEPLKKPSVLKVEDFADILSGRWMLWISLSAFVLILMKIRGNRQTIIPLIGAMSGVMGCSLYCIYIGRIAWRVTNGYILCGILSFVVMSFANYPSKDDTEKKTLLENNLQNQLISIVFFAFVTVIWLVAVIDEKDGFSIPKCKVTNQNQADTLDYIDKDKDNVYLYDDLIRFDGAYNVWTGHDPEYLDNYIPLSSCFAFGCRDKLEDFGIDDLYRDICKKSNIRVENQPFTTELLYQYLKDFCNPYISMSVVENINGNLYIRFSELIVPSDIQNIDVDCSIKINEEITTVVGVNSLYDVNVNISPEDAERYDDLLINVYLEDDTIHTYGLNYKDSKASGIIMCTEENWNPDTTNWILIGHDKSGEYHSLSEPSDILVEID